MVFSGVILVRGRQLDDKGLLGRSLMLIWLPERVLFREHEA